MHVVFYKTIAWSRMSLHAFPRVRGDTIFACACNSYEYQKLTSDKCCMREIAKCKIQKCVQMQEIMEDFTQTFASVIFAWSRKFDKNF